MACRPEALTPFTDLVSAAEHGLHRLHFALNAPSVAIFDRDASVLVPQHLIDCPLLDRQSTAVCTASDAAVPLGPMRHLWLPRQAADETFPRRCHRAAVPHPEQRR